MGSKTKIALFVCIGIAILVLMGYGIFSSKKLDEKKLSKVDSNIDDYLYDEASDTIDLDEGEDDLDGEEVIDEDSDFEVYEEEENWEDEEDPVGSDSKITNSNNDLEELYDPANKDQKEEPAKAEKVPPRSIDKTPESDIQEEKYLVVVGSFGSKRNATKKLKTLEKAGFSGMILQLENSKLYSVIAGKYKTESVAEEFAKEVEDAGIRAFVKEE